MSWKDAPWHLGKLSAALKILLDPEAYGITQEKAEQIAREVLEELEHPR